MTFRTHAVRSLLISAAALAVATPAWAQTPEEAQAQAADTPDVGAQEGDVIIVTAT